MWVSDGYRCNDGDGPPQRKQHWDTLGIIGKSKTIKKIVANVGELWIIINEY